MVRVFLRGQLSGTVNSGTGAPSLVSRSSMSSHAAMRATPDRPDRSASRTCFQS
jgi:hypothetical protein